MQRFCSSLTGSLAITTLSVTLFGCACPAPRPGSPAKDVLSAKPPAASQVHGEPADAAAERRRRLRSARERWSGFAWSISDDGREITGFGFDPGSNELAILKHVGVLPAVEDLDLRNGYFPPARFRRLLAYFPNVRRIDLTGCADLVPEMARAIAALPSVELVIVGYPSDAAWHAEFVYCELPAWRDILGGRVGVEDDASKGPTLSKYPGDQIPDEAH